MPLLSGINHPRSEMALNLPAVPPQVRFAHRWDTHAVLTWSASVCSNMEVNGKNRVRRRYLSSVFLFSVWLFIRFFCLLLHIAFMIVFYLDFYCPSLYSQVKSTSSWPSYCYYTACCRTRMCSVRVQPWAGTEQCTVLWYRTIMYSDMCCTTDRVWVVLALIQHLVIHSVTTSMFSKLLFLLFCPIIEISQFNSVIIVTSLLC